MGFRCLGAVVALSGLFAVPAHATSMIGPQAADHASAQASLARTEGEGGADGDSASNVAPPAKFGGVPIVIGSAPSRPATAPAAAPSTPPAPAAAPEESAPREAKDVPGPSALLLFAIGVAGLLIGRRIRSAR